MLWVHDMDSKISTFSERSMETLREIIRDQIDKVP